MKALTNELSKIETAKSNAASNMPPTHSTNNADGIYARLRRLEARLTNLEGAASTLRRDFNRIEKRQYRSKEPSSLENITGHADELVGLFGIRND